MYSLAGPVQVVPRVVVDLTVELAPVFLGLGLLLVGCAVAVWLVGERDPKVVWRAKPPSRTGFGGARRGAPLTPPRRARA